mgnify:CR=1 FL=1
MSLKIGLLSVYFGLFDDAMPGNFRESRENFSNELENFLVQFGDVTFPGLIDSEEKAEDAARVFKEAQLDVIIFAPSMAAPPVETKGGCSCSSSNAEAQSGVLMIFALMVLPTGFVPAFCPVGISLFVKVCGMLPWGRLISEVVQFWRRDAYT